MKKLLIAFLGMFLLLNVACSRDDDSSSSSSSVVGSWYMYSVSVNGTVLVNGSSQAINNSQVASACVQKTTLTFNENGTGNVTSWDDTSGSCTQVQNDDFTYTYNQSSKALTIKTSTNTDVTTLKSLTNSEMIGEETVSNQDIGGYKFTGKITTTLKKK